MIAKFSIGANMAVPPVEHVGHGGHVLAGAQVGSVCE